jgi:dTDP-4-dehydrorhamnose 3,5-epimerase
MSASTRFRRFAATSYGWDRHDRQALEEVALEIRQLTIAGAFELVPKVHGDTRGAFLEWFRADVFEEMTGHRFSLAQANCSVSAAGTLRGVHFAELPPSQAKYVTCVHGAILDVVVDMRVGSPTFGQWDSVTLNDSNHRAVYLSEGLGHAFLALQDDTVVNYLCSAPYAPGREHGINPLDPSLEIEWPRQDVNGAPLDVLLSEKDAQAPSLLEGERAGLLPRYADVQTFVAGLRALSQ